MFALCFPPTFGYGNAITFSGFVFGFPHGFIPVFLGAVIGSTCCFLLGRKISKKYINYLMSSSKKLVTFARIVEKKGFKVLLHTYIGSTLKNITAIFISDETLVDPSTGQPGTPKPREIPVANFVLLGLSSAFGFFTFIFFYFLVEKEIEKSKKLHTFEEVEYEALRD
ncbi:Golgi apparatus membrane protein tvp38 [Zancudomyces culisetae]|uniref:Golgi apparatus membrane protein TVP38 n=1 Tax=Zancudomyces culisetae TaxID=1213189 RepID=A0A1R1PM48_ZANCU|nr:Golgi apparatus membrane protein tvp38 [Zancudomyces culisetae]|eukprot:OMH82051.1 Golgi apparatus membrane protein tvp38 [Zancudomyces culisetae]